MIKVHEQNWHYDLEYVPAILNVRNKTEEEKITYVYSCACLPSSNRELQVYGAFFLLLPWQGLLRLIQCWPLALINNMKIGNVSVWCQLAS